MSGSKDGAFLNDAVKAAGIDTFGNIHVLNTDATGTLEVTLTNEPTIDIGKVDQGTPNTLANAWPVELSDGTNLLGTSTHPVRTDPTGTTTQPISGSVTVLNASIPVTQSGVWSVGRTWSLLNTTDSVNIGNFPATFGVIQSTSPWVVSGTVTANQGGAPWSVSGSGNFTVVQPTGSNLHTVLDSGTLTSITNALPAGTNVIGHVLTDSGSTTAVTGNVTVVQSTGSNLHTVVDSGTITANQGTANATPWNENLSQVGGSGVSLGQKAMASSIPVVLASDQAGLNTNLDKSGSGTIASGTDTVVATVNGCSTIVFYVSGTYTAAVIPQFTIDGTNWINAAAYPSFLATNAAGSIIVPCGGYKQVRIGVAFFSGTLNVVWEASSGESGLSFSVGQATSAAPSYSANSYNPLSLTLTGALRTDNSSVTQPTSAPTLTKGTQGVNGWSVQNLKDAGRTYVTFTADAVAGVASETLLTVTQNKQGTTTGSVTNYTPTSGKTLRIQSIVIGLQAGAAAAQWVRVKIRHNTAGATTTSSALVFMAACGDSAAVNNISAQISVPIPDGLEFFGDGTQTIGITHISSATSNVESVTVCGYEY